MVDRMINVDGVDPIIAAMANLVANVEDDLADELGDHAVDEESRVRARGRAAGGVAKLAARSVESRKSKRGGDLTAGGSGRIPGGGTFGDIFPGSEFGGGSRPATRQFRPYRPKGYWFFDQALDDEKDLDDQLAESITNRLEN